MPLAREEWKARALFRQIEIDRPLPATDFDGRATTHRALAERYGVRLSPTVILGDARGKPLAEPIVGLMPDFYAGLLDRALETARAAIR